MNLEIKKKHIPPSPKKMNLRSSLTQAFKFQTKQSLFYSLFESPPQQKKKNLFSKK